jgi:hypothetical protein
MLQELIRKIIPEKQQVKPTLPIIAHDGLWKEDERLLELVVQSIFRVRQLNGRFRKIFDHLNSRRASLETHEQLCQEIEKYLKELRSRGKLSPVQEKEHLELLAEHRRTTIATSMPSRERQSLIGARYGILTPLRRLRVADRSTRTNRYRTHKSTSL